MMQSEEKKRVPDAYGVWKIIINAFCGIMVTKARFYSTFMCKAWSMTPS